MFVVAILTSAASFASICGQWAEIKNVPEEGNISDNITITKQPVCYFTSGGSTYYFSSIEAAINKANSGSFANTSETIYVIPNDSNTSYTITTTCTLGTDTAGDNLRIIHAISSKDNDYDTTSNYTTSSFADNDATNKRKVQVVLSAKLTIKKNSQLVITGEKGPGSGMQGATVGQYAEMVINTSDNTRRNTSYDTSGSIDCYGTIKCYGYIKDLTEKFDNSENHTIEMRDGSVMYEPLVLYDYPGNASNTASKAKKCFPVNIYDLPNIRSKIKFNYGSELICSAHIYGSNVFVGHRTVESTIISTVEKSKGFIQLNNNSSLLWNVDCFYSSEKEDEQKAKTGSYTLHKCYIDLIGDCSLGYVYIYIKAFILPVTMDSRNFYLPISFIYNISVSNGVCDIPYATKFLPGSSFTVGSDSIVNAKSKLLFYQSRLGNNNNSIPSYPNTTLCNTPAKLVVNGKININSSFGGYISTSNTTAQVVTGSGYVVANDSYEYSSDGSTQYGPFTWDGNLELSSDESGSAIVTTSLEASKYYKSSENENYFYWYIKEIIDLLSIALNPSSGSSSAGNEAKYNVTVNTTPSTLEASKLSYSWEYPSSLTSVSGQGTKTLKFTTPKNSSTTDNVDYTIKVTVTYDKSDLSESNTILSTTGTFTATKSEGCLLPDAFVLMSDGSYSKASELKIGDMVMTFNHETGKVEPNIIIGNDDLQRPIELWNVIHLSFDNGAETDFVYEHGYFDLTTNKYEYLREDNFEQFIGHEFVTFDDDLNIKSTKLINAYIYQKYTQICAPVSAVGFNLIVDNMLSIEGGLTGLFNIFEYNPTTLAFDSEKMNADIEQYGLLDYSYFEAYFPEEIYNLLPIKYLSVSIGKGLITWDIFEGYVYKWKDQLLENLN